jgi:hypothetical protein
MGIDLTTRHCNPVSCITTIKIISKQQLCPHHNDLLFLFSGQTPCVSTGHTFLSKVCLKTEQTPTSRTGYSNLQHIVNMQHMTFINTSE